MQTLLPPGWPRPKGYANGVTARGRMVFVAGMVGWDAHGHFSSGELVPQVEQALRNIVAVLHEGGAQPEHIVRMTWYVLDKKAYMQAWPQIGRLFREIIGSYNAAMTAVEVSGLMEDQAQVEIEVTAVVPDPD
ncbi:MAG: RidA family protein [Betaproteobacteria bacterium]|nr:RidA family protein [Betaproteobacteria bacterium]NBT09553.1 RidA family protein [Betaproteobacteria bacterium]NBU48650.1 RidA family protein [Betaproteobacteria bacterium]NBX96482.1 RidA family protein [Betaproteobacteria bacterium]